MTEHGYHYPRSLVTALIAAEAQVETLLDDGESARRSIVRSPYVSRLRRCEGRWNKLSRWHDGRRMVGHVTRSGKWSVTRSAVFMRRSRCSPRPRQAKP